MIAEKLRDALKELVNIGVGKAAGSLNEILDSHIELEGPAIVLFDPENRDENLVELLRQQLTCVTLGFSGDFAGHTALAFPPQSAIKLVEALTGEQIGQEDLNSMVAGTLNEVGNIIINSVIGSISNILGADLNFTLPRFVEGSFCEYLRAEKLDTNVNILIIQTNFTVQDLQIFGNIFLIFEMQSFQNLLTAIDNLYK